MCRNIRQLRRTDDAGSATTGEAQAAALQFVRKVSGIRTPSVRHRGAFDAAVHEVAVATARLLAAMGTDVAEGPDPFADPVQRRAILDARADRRPRLPGTPGSAEHQRRTARAATAEGPA